jgi:hypothetical protein
MPGTDLLPYAAKSLKERMITRILEREDEGHLRWTPSGIYEQIALQNTEMYPAEISSAVLKPFHSDEFMAELAERRYQRYISQLPGTMLANRIGRRIVDMVTPIIFSKLATANAIPEILDMREARMLLKDALSHIGESDAALAGGNKKGKAEEEDKPGLNFADAQKLLAATTGDRQEVIARAMVNELLAQARSLAAETIDGEAVEG